MEVRRITDNIAVAGQICAADVKSIAKMGFRTLISNRPDSEDGTVPHAEIRAAAEAAGMAFHYLPVVSGAITPGDVSAMSQALMASEQPVLAYCRTGGRCANLLQLVDMAR